ncbi:MAG: hypothetical protein ACTSR3_02135 [Candidatus Helarchaeota archaeon]
MGNTAENIGVLCFLLFFGILTIVFGIMIIINAISNSDNEILLAGIFLLFGSLYFLIPFIIYIRELKEFIEDRKNLEVEIKKVLSSDFEKINKLFNLIVDKKAAFTTEEASKVLGLSDEETKKVLNKDHICQIFSKAGEFYYLRVPLEILKNLIENFERNGYLD